MNSLQTECYEYSIQDASVDVLFETDNYQGDSYVFLSTTSSASSVNEDNVVLSSTIEHPNQVLLAKSVDRSDWGLSTGTYYLCLTAISPVSSNVTVIQGDYNSVYNVDNNQLFTFDNQKQDYTQFRFTNSDFQNVAQSNITIEVSYFDTLTKPAVYWSLCLNNGGSDINNCVLTEE